MRSQRTTKLSRNFEAGCSRVGSDYQATVPDYVYSPKPLYKTSLSRRELNVWKPSYAPPTQDLELYFKKAADYGYSEEAARVFLHSHKYDITRATTDFPNFQPLTNYWNKHEVKKFLKCVDCKPRKNFVTVKRSFPAYHMGEVFALYYGIAAPFKAVSRHGNKHNQQMRTCFEKAVKRNFVLSSAKSTCPTSVDTRPHWDSLADSEEEFLDAELEHYLVDRLGESQSKRLLTGVQQCKSSIFVKGSLSSLRSTLGATPKTSHPSGGDAQQASSDSSSLFERESLRQSRPSKSTLPLGLHYEHEEFLKFIATPHSTLEENRLLEMKKIPDLDKELHSRLKAIDNQSKDINDGLDKYVPEGGFPKISYRWTRMEFSLLLVALSKLGTDFTAVSRTLGTKSETFIRDFYTQYAGKFGLDRLTSQALKSEPSDADVVIPSVSAERSFEDSPALVETMIKSEITDQSPDAIPSPSTAGGTDQHSLSTAEEIDQPIVIPSSPTTKILNQADLVPPFSTPERIDQENVVPPSHNPSFSAVEKMDQHAIIPLLPTTKRTDQTNVFTSLSDVGKMNQPNVTSSLPTFETVDRPLSTPSSPNAEILEESHAVPSWPGTEDLDHSSPTKVMIKTDTKPPRIVRGPFRSRGRRVTNIAQAIIDAHPTEMTNVEAILESNAISSSPSSTFSRSYTKSQNLVGRPFRARGRGRRVTEVARTVAEHRSIELSTAEAAFKSSAIKSSPVKTVIKSVTKSRRGMGRSFHLRGRRVIKLAQAVNENRPTPEAVLEQNASHFSEFSKLHTKPRRFRGRPFRLRGSRAIKMAKPATEDHLMEAPTTEAVYEPDKTSSAPVKKVLKNDARSPSFAARPFRFRGRRVTKVAHALTEEHLLTVHTPKPNVFQSPIAGLIRTAKSRSFVGKIFRFRGRSVSKFSPAVIESSRVEVPKRKVGRPPKSLVTADLSELTKFGSACSSLNTLNRSITMPVGRKSFHFLSRGIRRSRNRVLWQRGNRGLHKSHSAKTPKAVFQGTPHTFSPLRHKNISRQTPQSAGRGKHKLINREIPQSASSEIFTVAIPETSENLSHRGHQVLHRATTPRSRGRGSRHFFTRGARLSLTRGTIHQSVSRGGSPHIGRPSRRPISLSAQQSAIRGRHEKTHLERTSFITHGILRAVYGGRGRHINRGVLHLVRRGASEMIRGHGRRGRPRLRR